MVTQGHVVVGHRRQLLAAVGELDVGAEEEALVVVEQPELR